MSTEISLQCLEGEYIENAESAGGAGSSLYINTTAGNPAVAATTYLSGSWVSRGPITTGQTLIQRIA